MADAGKPKADDVPSDTKKKRHWLEIGYFSSQIVLVVIGILALKIYNGQLTVMQGQLNEMKRSGEQSTEQMWSAIGNVNWMARSMDLSQKESQKGIESNARQSQEQFTKILGQMKGQIATAQGANAIAKQALEAQTRPWIGIVGLPQFTIAGDPAKFDLSLHNYGNSPAIVAAAPPFMLGAWNKQEIGWASAAEKNNGNDWCRVDRFPSTKPTQQLYRDSIPIFQGDAQKITVRTRTSGTYPPTRFIQLLMGCIPFATGAGEEYHLFVMYRLTHDADGSANIKLVDLRTSDE